MADYEDGIFSNLPQRRLRADDDNTRSLFRELLGLYVPEGPLPPRPSGKGGPSINQGVAPTHSPQALAYLARTVGGNEGGNGANIATLIDGLVADGVWSKLDCLYVLAQQNATDALLNLIGTSYALTQVGALAKPAPRTGSVVFTAYQGFSGFNTGGSYFDTGFNASTAVTPNFVQNSASLGVWSYANIPSGIEIANSTSAAGLSNILVNYSGDGNFYARVNAAGAAGVTSPGTKGLYVGDRSSSANVVQYWNGVSQATQSSVSAAPFNGDTTISWNTVPSTQTLSAAFIGASLGSAGQLALYNRLRTYMTAVGVP